MRGKPTLIARKVIESTKIGYKSFQTERKNLEQFKNCLSKNENIMMSFATFVHGSQFNIVYRLADLDLHEFLYGRYTGFSQRCTDFTPEALFEEAWCLANALDFLHEELKLRTGKISCAHMDLKPENILIEELLSSSNSGMSVGRWKIGDFGIATIRPVDTEAHETWTSQGQQFTPGDVIRDISMNPPREPGPYQAPEMQPNKGLRVSKSSDMWSFGCIISMVLAFAIGGPKKVEQLYDCREKGYLDDYFYMEGPAVKPEIIDWLRRQTEDHDLKDHWQWIRECKSLIQRLLTIQKEHRPSAEMTGSCLLNISKSSGRIPLAKRKLWGASKQQQPPILLTSSARDDKNSLHSTQSSVINGEHSGSTHPPLPRLSFAVSDELRSSQSMFRPSLVAQSPSFVRLETPLNVRKACLSPCGRRAAFLSENIVYLYQLDSLDGKPARWQAKTYLKRIDKESMSRSETFKCTENRQWTSVFLAGSYCALASTSKEHNEDTVLLRRLKQS